MRSVARFPRLKTPCKAFRRWKRSGFRERAAPLTGKQARKARALGKTDPGLGRAVRRLAELGMSRRRASGFAGGRVLRPILRAVDRELGTGR